ncbi:MAG: PSD1 and planctomycete cytochrome C domain-containing protein [Fimbriiglobus sp.]
MTRPAAGIVVLLATAAVGRAAPLDFNRDVRPILFNTCVACHGPDEKERKGDLRLDTRDGATENGAVVPGKPDESAIIARLLTEDTVERMPPPKTGKKLTAKEIATLREWVKQGANYAVHWAYEKPARSAVPTVSDPKWVRNPVDAFVLARLDAEGLKPSPEADRFALARRVALDITGLPPTPADADAYVNDSTPGAYERYVDTLLAKPAFGEHWARMWLDLARYADSAGYADDSPRTIWAYRDYVIRSFNANKPFDRFTVEQMAGDLLPNATEDQIVATAFHRNTLTNNEGGTNDEEFRNVAVVDRVSTTFAVWMGTSMACAQCHTHKYDPITQAEFFRAYAFLNNTEDADDRDESPIHGIGDTPAKKMKREALEAAAARLEKIVKHQPALIQAALRVDADAARSQANKLQPTTTVPVMRERPANQRRVTKLQFRGNFLDLGDVLTEGVPAALHAFPKNEPLNRLGFARWLVAPDNPLTARVTVNRFWEQVFGIGLVRTSEEFGAQGEPPSHQELLDWLATEFVRENWDVKHFLKLLVTSSAYRQTSKVPAELASRDPENRWIGRGPRVRLPAETVRDQALAVSGLLSAKMHGPSVKPPQPAFGLKAAFGSSMDWQTSPGEDRYRRGIYTEWRRTNPYPSMAAFDAPSREACTIRRNRSNTPLQALVTLNDPVYVEAAQSLARKAVAAGTTPAEKATAAFRLCLLRSPSDKELSRLVALYEDVKATYAADPAKAARLATDPLGPLPKGADAVELAAWTVVGNVLLNLDEMFMKR